MQGIVTLAYTLGPIDAGRQLPIDHVKFQGREKTPDDSLPWTDIGNSTPAGDGTGTFEIDQVAPGDWQYQGIEVDTAGGEGAPKLVEVSMPADAPSSLAALTAAVS